MDTILDGGEAVQKRRLWELRTPWVRRPWGKDYTIANVFLPDGDYAIVLFTSESRAEAFRRRAKGSPDLVPPAEWVLPVLLSAPEVRRRYYGPEVVIDPRTPEAVVGKRQAEMDAARHGGALAWN